MTPAYDKIPGTDFPLVQLAPIQPAHADLLHGWVNDEKARCWLDLGSGRQQLPRIALYALLTSRRNHARLFHLPGDPTPLGLICLNDADNEMGSAEVWGLRGVYSRTAPPNIAASTLLQALATGFLDRGRDVIGSWVVDLNQLSILMHRKLGLTETGRQRARHRLNGKLHDRVLFDITREEFAARFPDVPSELGRTFRACERLVA